MRSSKNRSRSKNRGGRPSGNVVNRVFDSSGPEGKVRGTPQQIIDKYTALARDAQLAGDRVATENFQQHAEHYTRMLAEAMAEQEAKRQQQERENQARQQRENEKRERREAEQQRQEARQDEAKQDGAKEEGGPVDVPEGGGEEQPPKKRSRSRSRKNSDPQPAEASEG